MFKIFIEWNASYKRQKEAEMEKKNSELNFLKAQLNPHFFFNSLNTIFSLSIKKSEQTPVAILNLSELMRYMLYETNKDTVPLEEEILYIKNYIELQKLRLTENVNIIFEVDCDETSIFIPPLLFISFIENAFKHGIDPSKENEIIVKFKVQKNEIDFSVINDINRIKSNGDSFGLGIENTVKRINLYFPERNELETYADSGKFYVKLKLKLNED
jgi:Putative regulator of cell autolysis